jgi:hypothetical protein
LTADEKAILAAVGIDEPVQESLKAYLPTFFDVLPDCQTDSSLYLNKKCDVPYFVLWSTKFAERQSAMDRLKENKEKTNTMSDYDMVIHKAVISEMKPKVTIYDELFTIVQNETKHKPFRYNDLFVLLG